jgi:hypothetical protein
MDLSPFACGVDVYGAFLEHAVAADHIDKPGVIDRSENRLARLRAGEWSHEFCVDAFSRE